MSILWLAIAIAMVIGLIKTSVKLLKFVFTVCLIAGLLMFVFTLLGKI